MTPEQLAARQRFIDCFASWESVDTNWFEEGLWAECEATFERQDASLLIEAAYHAQTDQIRIVFESDEGDLHLRCPGADAAQIADPATVDMPWRDIVRNWARRCSTLWVVDDEGNEGIVEPE